DPFLRGRPHVAAARAGLRVVSARGLAAHRAKPPERARRSGRPGNVSGYARTAYLFRRGRRHPDVLVPRGRGDRPAPRSGRKTVEDPRGRGVRCSGRFDVGRRRGARPRGGRRNPHRRRRRRVCGGPVGSSRGPRRAAAPGGGGAAEGRGTVRVERDRRLLRARAPHAPPRGRRVTAAAAVFAGIAVLLLLWSYGVYPYLVGRLARRAPARAVPSSISPSVDVLISAFDEEGSIAGRILNLLSQQYPGVLTVSIGCDGCRDSTADLARDSGSDRVRVAEFGERRGK